jgi:predicted transposase YdaD
MTRKPHDALFKAGFELPEHAAEFLRGVLPAALVDAIAWPTMTRESGSFIDPDLADRHSDLLFSVDLQVGRRALIYLLLEHQSTIEPDMLLRMLDYLVRVWKRHGKQHPGPLPLTIPLVISHAPGGWTVVRTMHELFDPHPSSIPGIAELVPNFSVLIEDLVYVTNEDLKSRALSAFPKLVLWALRDARNAEQLFSNLATWGHAFGEAMRTPRGMESVSVLLRYISLVTHDLHLTKFRAKIHELAPEAEEATMTLAEQLIAEGLAKGKAEGLAKGKAEGLAAGQISVLSKLLTLKFGELPPSYAARLAAASLAELDAWVERVLPAATLDDVFSA